MQGGDGRRSTGSARGTFMVQMGGFPSLWPLPDELPLLYHHQGHQRLHRCAGFPTSYTRDLFVNHGVLRVLHPPVLLKLSHFPAVFTQALIPSLIQTLQHRVLQQLQFVCQSHFLYDIDWVEGGMHLLVS